MAGATIKAKLVLDTVGGSGVGGATAGVGGGNSQTSRRIRDTANATINRWLPSMGFVAASIAKFGGWVPAMTGAVVSAMTNPAVAYVIGGSFIRSQLIKKGYVGEGFLTPNSDEWLPPELREKIEATGDLWNDLVETNREAMQRAANSADDAATGFSSLNPEIEESVQWWRQNTGQVEGNTTATENCTSAKLTEIEIINRTSGSLVDLMNVIVDLRTSAASAGQVLRDINGRAYTMPNRPSSSSGAVTQDESTEAKNAVATNANYELVTFKSGKTYRVNTDSANRPKASETNQEGSG